MANYVKLNLLNEHFQCGICQGYIIDATTVSECLHSFCKSCIFHFIESIDNCCPTCNQSLGDINNCLAFDSSLQRLIYQLIPNLLANELDRRKRFQEVQEIESTTILNEDSLVNLKLINLPSNNTRLLELIKNNRNTKIESDENDDSEPSGKETNNKSEEPNTDYPESTTVKYIQCIAQTPIRIICRMLQNKYNVPQAYCVRIYCMGHKLGEAETLLEIFTSFIKSKCEVLELEYKFVRLKKTARRSKDLQKESTQLVDALSRSLDIQDNTKKRQNSPIKKKDSTDTTISTKSSSITKTSSKKTAPVKSKKDEKEPKTSKAHDEPVSGSPAKEQQQDLNETVYYSDEEDSSEGKLLIADDSNSSDSAKPLAQSSLKHSYNSRKKTDSMCD